MTPSIIFCINKHVSLFELRIVRITLRTLTYITQLSVINNNIINGVYVGKFDIAVQCINTKVIKEMEKKIVVVQWKGATSVANRLTKRFVTLVNGYTNPRDAVVEESGSQIAHYSMRMQYDGRQ